MQQLLSLISAVRADRPSDGDNGPHGSVQCVSGPQHVARWGAGVVGTLSADPSVEL